VIPAPSATTRSSLTNGMLKTAPESWRDYFFPEIHGSDGS
jgi:hypothetical protein